MFLFTSGTVWLATEGADKTNGHMKLFLSQQTILEGNITLDNFLHTIDCSQPF